MSPRLALTGENRAFQAQLRLWLESCTRSERDAVTPPRL